LEVLAPDRKFFPAVTDNFLAREIGKFAGIDAKQGK